VEEHGPGARKTTASGTPVVALPLLRSGTGVDTTGLSVHAPGGYAEQTLVQESLMMAIPNGLSIEVAALTEPMAVGWHAVRRGQVSRRTVAIVVGCGPVGLAVILLLKAKGVRTVVASDYSAGRRALATACGAEVVIDPAVSSPSAPPRATGISRTSRTPSNWPSARGRSLNAYRWAGGMLGDSARRSVPLPNIR
jgi:threonine dehydrogenase-like Zn-dependent dehydrogenase